MNHNNGPDSGPEIPRRLDAEWYHQQLKRLPVSLRQRAAEGYRRVWLEAYEAEPVGHKKANAAGRAANERLRLFTEAQLNNAR